MYGYGQGKFLIPKKIYINQIYINSNLRIDAHGAMDPVGVTKLFM